MTVYGDVLFGVNAVVDFLLYCAGARLCAFPVGRWRLILASALGGLFALGELLPMGKGVSLLFKAAAFCVPAAVAFGVGRRSVRPVGLTLLCGTALAGVFLVLRRIMGLPLVLFRGSVYYPVTARVLIFLAGVCYLLAAVCFSGTLRNGAGEVCDMTLRLNCRRVRLTALYDTGNNLHDPIGGRGVAVVNRRRFCELLGISAAEVPSGDGVTVMEYLRKRMPEVRFLLVPFRAMGTEGGLLCCVPCVAKIGKRERKILAAMAPTEMGDGNFEALIGGRTV